MPNCSNDDHIEIVNEPPSKLRVVFLRLYALFTYEEVYHEKKIMVLGLLVLTISPIGINETSADESTFVSELRLGSAKNTSPATGVVKVASNNAYTYSSYSGGARVKKLPIQTEWLVHEEAYDSTGQRWYRVSNNEWIKWTDITIVYLETITSGVIKVNHPTPIATWTSYFDHRTVVGYIPSNTKWKYDKVATFNGMAWFRIAHNNVTGISQWVPMIYVNVEY
ncbi:hypothetical protein G7062_06510 [Erysipelothrix sp. HDW6C]|uniref:hypothetical protein n=1 Tax=Erysipelothrix sp. HDW6C TaxID=2714930 RepID=UPI00140885F3|nr:hypothetical protein [Erysipelothrix sp. HDW6C]QIK69960.1 hypothetical protein G7062_06510 [Erysipelothrix sp. HDW6C]